MAALVLAAFLTASLEGDDSARREALLLIDTVESLQQPVEDFRCEYEGTLRVRGNVAQSFKVAEDQVLDSYSGVFTWKKGGETRIESWHRRAPSNQILRDTIVIRPQDRQAEQYSRLNDAAVGAASITDPKRVMTWVSSMGTIFLIDKIKREVADPDFEPSVSDDHIDGRPLKVVNIAIKLERGAKQLMYRYWIDLHRGGHVVRREDYSSGNVMNYRLNITLTVYKVGGAEVWLPTSGESVGYNALVDRKPAVMKEPQGLERVYVVNGTMELNKHPGRDVFTMRYKPGTPISDNLRKLTYEYGQQKLGPNPTKSEVQRMLNDELAKAEDQKKELVVVPPSQGFDWSAAMAWVFGGAVLILSVALWIQRWRR